MADDINDDEAAPLNAASPGYNQGLNQGQSQDLDSEISPELDPASDTVSQNEAEAISKWKNLMGICLVTGILVGASVFILFQKDEVPSPVAEQASSSITVGGPFVLTNQNGEQTTEQDLRGKFALISFGYTYCPDICPTTLTDMTDAINLLAKEGDKILPVFITVDPERDTPEYMKEYISYFHPRFLALTGTSQQIANVAKSYSIYYAKSTDGNENDPQNDYVMDHSSSIYLIGPDGSFKKNFSHGMDSTVLAEQILNLM